jgi:hypothetical protein
MRNPSDHFLRTINRDFEMVINYHSDRSLQNFVKKIYF